MNYIFMLLGLMLITFAVGFMLYAANAPLATGAFVTSGLAAVAMLTLLAARKLFVDEHSD